MILEGDALPCAPNNDRIMVRPDPPQGQTDGGLIIPEIAQKRASFGVIVHAGLKARDELYDNGHEIGDRIWFGQFAGVWEEWDHIIVAGKDTKCPHESWSRRPSPGDRMQAKECSACGARRLQEPVLIMNVGDILVNERLEERRRSAGWSIVRGQTADGKTCHFWQRGPVSTTNHTGVTTNAA